MLTSNEEGSNFIQNLPPEILILIFGNLTIYELAEVQKTCKAWYAIAQKTPTLWRKSEPFFIKFHENLWEIPKFVRRVQTLCRLSAGKLDEIFFSLSEENEGKAEIASFLESIPNLNPTSLRLRGMPDSAKYFPIVGRCKSLRELDLGTYGTPFKNNVFKDCPIQEAKLEKLTLNQDSFRKWRSNGSCLSVSSSIKTFILEGYQGFDLAQALDFLYHCRQSIENFEFRSLHIRILSREVTGLHREIIFPNLVKASFFSLWDGIFRTDNELIPLYCFKCLQIQELNLPSKYFLKLFDSVESVKRVRLNWPVDDLAEMFRTFPNIETFEASLRFEDPLRSLVDLVPKQLKNLNLSVSCHSRYDNTLNVKKGRRSLSHQLLDLVKKRSTSTHSESLISICQEGAIEFCYITMEQIGRTICGLGYNVSISMCKYNFVEIFTELSKMEALDTSSDTNGIISSD